MILLALQCWFHQFEKVQTSWLASHCLIVLFGSPAFLYIESCSHLYAGAVCVFLYSTKLWHTLQDLYRVYTVF